MQVCYADFFLDVPGMVFGSVENCCLDLFQFWVIAQYALELINWSEFGSYRCWRQQMIRQDPVKIKNGFPAECRS